MLTGRGWWCLFSVFLLLLLGVLRTVMPLAIAGLALLLWFAWEWLTFSLRVRAVLPRVRVRREVLDERGPVTTLWEGQTFRVRVVMHGSGRWDSLAHVVVSDPVPFAVEYVKGETTRAGGWRGGEELALEYTIRCPRVGVVRFEGLRLETSDLQGFFYHSTFVRIPVLLRILPRLVTGDGFSSFTKGHNQLPPPGIHRLRSPGSGSELLDLRDYQPGDPPRTIAWKVSARRDRLITREYESEVPLRCTLLLDTSSSVRVPSPAPDGSGATKALDGLIRVAGGVVQGCIEVRDLVGVCVFDEQGSRDVRPERGPAHQSRLLHLLADAGSLAPAAGQADPDLLTPLAYSLAEDLYPDLLRSEVNAIPAWVVWLAAFPGHRRRWRGYFEYLHRRKRLWLFWGTTLVPLCLFLVNLIALCTGALPGWANNLLVQAWVMLSPLAFLAAWALFLFSLVVSGRHRRLARWRKQLSALLAVRYDLGTGALGRMLEDDDSYSLALQRFLAEHQVPFQLPLYDDQGRYLFACPEKVSVLASALVRAVSRGRDNELFVLLADLLELDDQLGPLLEAVRLAQARHHQVVIVCPWPPGLALPSLQEPNPAVLEAGLAAANRPGTKPLLHLLGSVAQTRFEAAYTRLRRTFARLGVAVVCAASEEAVPLVLARMDRLRKAARNR